MNRLKNLVFLILLGVVLSACTKTDRDLDLEFRSSFDNAVAQNIFADIFKQIDVAALSKIELTDDTISKNNTSCPTEFVLPSFPNPFFPKTLYIDYGDSINCQGTDGIKRKGIVTAQFSGKYRDPNTTITLTLDSFYFNDELISGEIRIKNKGLNTDSNLVYSLIVTDAEITQGKQKIFWNCDLTLEFIEGDLTKDPTDDVYLIKGTTEGRSTTGNSFTASDFNDVKFKNNCRWISNGTQIVQPTNLGPRTVNFGSGNCDSEFMITVNESVFTVILK